MAELRAPDVGQLTLGRGARLDECRRQVRPRMALDRGAFGAGILRAHPRLERARPDR